MMVNNALILGMFGFVDPKANKMVQASALKNKTDGLTITEQLSKDVVMKQEAGSKNKKTFSKDKKLVESEITNLKEKLAELNKLDKESKPKVIKSKEIETQRIEKEIKTLKQNIKEAKTESIESMNKTKLETLEKELIDIKEDKGKVMDWQTMELGMSNFAKKGWPKSQFYKFYTPSDLKVFTAKEAADNFKKTKSMMGWNW